MIEGALILLAGLVIGRFLPSRRKPKTPQAICGCKHHLAKHDPQTRACHATIEQRKYNKAGENIGEEHVPCTCRQYIGPTPVEAFFTMPMLPPGQNS